MSPLHKELVILAGEIQSPPFSVDARREAGFLLRRAQAGENLELPHSRPMPLIGPGCHELRIVDKDKAWRLVYMVDEDAVVVLEVFMKKTAKTPQKVIRTCQQRIRMYEASLEGD